MIKDDIMRMCRTQKNNGGGEEVKKDISTTLVAGEELIIDPKFEEMMKEYDSTAIP